MNNQRWLAKNFFMFFITWGIFLPYWTGWLINDKGLTVSEASIIMGFGLVARAVATMFVFPYVSKVMSNKNVLLFFTIASLIVTLFYIPIDSFAGLFIITMLFSAFYPALLPAVESSASTLMQHGKIHYGKARSLGSFGYVIAVLIISMITGMYGEQMILWTMILGLTALLAIQLMPAPQVLSLAPKQDITKALSMKSLFKVKSFGVVLLVVILLQGAHASYYNYGYIYLQDLNVNLFYIGMILNVAVLFEILYFLKADTFLTKWKPSSLMLLAAIGATVRWLIVYLFPNMPMFIISQALHALSFAMAHYAFIRYISKALPKEQIPNAQGIYSALAMSLSAALLTLLGGALYEIEPGLAFLGMIIFTVPAIFLILFTKKRFDY
ncbi:3-phenylpropionate MFS transporter [Lysinibacillus sp. 2017]|uniref:3-phenylpropionate MFS transporter n=1 Tax=unclassified Lysinibacillus TaxID=2636778 RepID=UPI000D5294EF|nr:MULTISPECIES: 3-phenylpropionate MFS transporter [unclassified Lysinibacillus]AWE08140.1 3-phenylpropionate MFS transporter [Lysinibacillus sp. 2017]TGN36356.1 3-phenylpropionate MFS transporter [Lysinibacillus sp. S2017]